MVLTNFYEYSRKESEKNEPSFGPLLTWFWILLFISGCTTPATYIKNNVSDKINYAYSKGSIAETKNCVKQKWQTRDIHSVFDTIGQLDPLTETNFDNYIRLQFHTMVIFDISEIDNETEIKQSHQIDTIQLVKVVSKNVMIQCSYRQNFTNLKNVNENAYSK